MLRMGAVRAALEDLRALGPREKCFTDFLSCASKGFVEANEYTFGSFPSVARKGDGKGYGLFCGPRPARAGEVVLHVPPALWLPYCAEAAVRKAEAGAPDVLARVSHACARMSGGSASSLAPFSCLALELLFTLERDTEEPYLGLLWEASRSAASLPHPLLMGPRHLDHLQASPLRKSITIAAETYSLIHRSILGLGGEPPPSPGGYDNAATPSAASTRDFLWALGIVLSRGVSEDAAGGAGLVPYLDFANHGDILEGGIAGADGVGGGGGGGGGGRAMASCVRGFDERTGSHYLRALRDVAPGEELLIDYGSARKPLYQFVRTYGFVNPPSSSSSSSSSSSGSNAGRGQRGSSSDRIRVHVSRPTFPPPSPPPTPPSPPTDRATSANNSEPRTFGGPPGASDYPANHSRIAGDGDASGDDARVGGEGSDSSPDGATQPGSAASSEGSGAEGMVDASFFVEVQLGDTRDALDSLGAEGSGGGSEGGSSAVEVPAASASATPQAVAGAAAAAEAAAEAAEATRQATAGAAATLAAAPAAPQAAAAAAAAPPPPPQVAAEAAAGAAAVAPQTAAGAAAEAAEAAEQCAALEEHLRRYSTSLEEDLEVLRGCSPDQEQEKEQEQEQEQAASSRAVMSGWVQMCVSVRAAEKIALRRALRVTSAKILRK